MNLYKFTEKAKIYVEQYYYTIMQPRIIILSFP